MRVTLGLVAVAGFLVAVPATAKAPNFFSLDVSPAPAKHGLVCGKTVASTRVEFGARVRATIRLTSGGTHAGRRPFVIAVQRCQAGAFRTIDRFRLSLPSRRRSATILVKMNQAGALRLEARPVGGSSPSAAAIQHVVVAPSLPEIVSVQYGLFGASGESPGYHALIVRTRDADGQIIGLDVSQTSPPSGTRIIGDGRCGLNGRRNGEIGTTAYPMELQPGRYTFVLRMTSSPCGSPGELEERGQSVDVVVP
jgi:hypothetical protein